MMNRILIFIVLSVSVISCSSLRFEKKRYSKGFFVSVNASKNKKPTQNFMQNYLSEEEANRGDLIIKQEETFPEEARQIEQNAFSDTVRVYLKNGKVYQGIITEEKENGVFLQISPQRTIYLSRYEIDEIVVVQQNNEGSNNSTQNTNNTSDEYYTSGNTIKQQPSHEKSSRLKRRLDDSVPKQIKNAETLFLLSGIFAISLGFLFPIFFILGLIYLRKGYHIALADPDRYDMDRINRLRDAIRKVLLIFLSLFLITLLVIGIWLLILYVI